MSPPINYLFGGGWGGAWGAYTIYTNHQNGNLLHKKRLIKLDVVRQRFATKHTVPKLHLNRLVKRAENKTTLP